MPNHYDYRKCSQCWKSDHGKAIIMNGWRAAWITEAVADARRNDSADLVDPFECISFIYILYNIIDVFQLLTPR